MPQPSHERHVTRILDTTTREMATIFKSTLDTVVTHLTLDAEELQASFSELEMLALAGLDIVNRAHGLGVVERHQLRSLFARVHQQVTRPD